MYNISISDTIYYILGLLIGRLNDRVNLINKGLYFQVNSKFHYKHIENYLFDCDT